MLDIRPPIFTITLPISHQLSDYGLPLNTHPLFCTMQASDGEVYSPLPKGNYIRLLQVELVGRDDLIGSLETVHLDKCPFQYKALSYAWGASEPVTELKLRGGQSLQLNQTLSDLFGQLKTLQASWTLWIDALCINQKNDEEKSSQVQLMRRIYSAADQVIMWLGTRDEESHAAFRFMNLMRNHSWKEDWEEEKKENLEDIRYVFTLLARPWFRRTWVIQEVVLNRNVAVMCGDDSVDFRVFECCVYAVWLYFDVDDYGDDHPSILGLWHASELMAILREFRKHRSVSFEKLLETSYFCKATDDRDKVYGFMGLARHRTPLPAPDYSPSTSFQQVYLMTAEALLCHGTSRNVLALAGIARRRLPSDLPTWVPDLRNEEFEQPIQSCYNAKWKAGGRMEAKATREGADYLRIRVRPIDEVSVTCSPFNSRSVKRQKKAMRQVLALRPMHPAVVSEDEWNDTVAMSMIMGLDVDDQPVNREEYLTYFREWLEWLHSSNSQEDMKRIKGNRFQRTTGPRVDDWNAFMTQTGIFCIGPQAVRVDDVLCTVPGCRLPLIFRQSEPESMARGDPRDPDERLLPEYTLVSWCFAVGLMEGEHPAQKRPAIEVLLR
ncbi:hypothetical protein CkaCkLH20_00876 [Colletotrichum karsti]|uniref:Heterokaryon incompatibility domain-containing protein n=1 Tax=Colletotrichum karsti TaxID=1095194 RepID=A0A9P6LQ43_9PEZI|nr:uncharacterized protein CkaCkLH20_00876 [Colletotrichum karsti]KAF9881730.1 hypothetical protein CkaCkLH20_00876 [Colletotrichum karsti]